jgi:hypothetical protein
MKAEALTDDSVRSGTKDSESLQLYRTKEGK